MKRDKKTKSVYIRGDVEMIVKYTVDMVTDSFAFGCDQIIKMYKILEEHVQKQEEAKL